MRKLITILFLLAISKSFATQFTIGTGSGSASVTSMSGHSIGDTGVVTPGTYNNLTFSNLNGITILNGNGLVTVTGVLSLSSLAGCKILGNGSNSQTYGFLFTNTSTTSITTGHLSDDVFAYFQFSHTEQLCIDYNNQSEVYNGTRASLNAVNVVHHDWLLNSTGPIFQGSFAGDTTFQGTTDSIQFYNIQADSIYGDGDCIYGNGLYDLIVHDVYATNTALSPSGDRGFFDISGSWRIYNIYRYGGYGYLIRGQGSGFNGKETCYMYNCFDGGTINYGTIDARNNASDTTTGVTPPFTRSCNQYYYNMTAGNKQANFYTAPFMVLGGFLKTSGYDIGMSNNLIFNNQTNNAYAGGNHISFQAFSDAMTDSVDNVYYANPITSGLFYDTLTFLLKAGSPAIDAGATLSLFSVDHAGVPRPQGLAWDIGWQEFIFTIPGTYLTHPRRGKHIYYQPI